MSPQDFSAILSLKRLRTWFLIGGCCEGRSLWAWVSLVTADVPESIWTDPTGVGWEEPSIKQPVSFNQLKKHLWVTHYLPADPVVRVVEGVAFTLKQFSEQSPQIFIVWFFKEVQPSHVS